VGLDGWGVSGNEPKFDRPSFALRVCLSFGSLTVYRDCTFLGAFAKLRKVTRRVSPFSLRM
jgi:hypothetical protein